MSDDFAQKFAMSKYASSKDRERAIVEYVEHFQTRLAEVEAENARLKSLLDKNMASISANNLKQAFANETTKEVCDE